jgi:DMSO/TMAO reductase YedYZ molybdopterin-dependent catalytic subunit
MVLPRCLRYISDGISDPPIISKEGWPMKEERKIVTNIPENSETPLEEARSWVTPNRLFFVRNHFTLPEVPLESWMLRVGGCVERPFELSWSELTRMPERTVFVTMECAGNGRSFLGRKQPGVPWGAGAVGHAEWTGVPLHVVLQKAGLRPDAVEIVFVGHDQGTEADHPELMSFARSLPLAKALQPDTLLAYRMNGELLEPAHGFPLRLLVPGWYGVASVKWLTSIEAVEQPFKGYYQTVKYTVQRETGRGRETTVVGPMAVKAEIIRPLGREVLGIGTNRIFGVAWAADAVARVEVSVDGGLSWSPAQLIGPRAAYSWTMWEYLWEAAEPGDYTVLARATSAAGQVQPTHHDPLNGGYQIHFSRPRTLRVERTRRIRDQSASPEMMHYDMNAFAEENMRFPLDISLEFGGGEGI